MKRRLLLGAAAAVVPLMQVPASAQSDEWQTVVSPDLRFRLEMPAQVNKSTARSEEHTSELQSH